MRPNEEQP